MSTPTNIERAKELWQRTHRGHSPKIDIEAIAKALSEAEERGREAGIKDLLIIGQVAKMVGITRQGVMKAIYSKNLKAFKISSMWFTTRQNYDKWAIRKLSKTRETKS